MPLTGSEMVQIECKVEHTTAKAWLVVDNMSGNQAWLPKSVATMDEAGADPDGNIIFTVPEWWLKKNNFI